MRSLTPSFCYRFYGDHALGGERRTVAAMRVWWERVFGLLPGVRFKPREVMLAGWPWATPPDGTAYDFNQFVETRWGRITEVRTLEDTQKPDRALRRKAAAGIREAEADPIADGRAAGETYPGGSS